MNLSVFRLFEKEEGFELTEALEIHFIELPKLLVKWRERLGSPWEDVLVRWLFLLEGSEDEEINQCYEFHDNIKTPALPGSLCCREILGFRWTTYISVLNLFK